MLARFVLMKKGGGGKVAINPDRVSYIRSAAGAFTDIFFDGQQVAVEGTFEEVVSLLSERRMLDRRDSDRRDSDRRESGPAAGR